MSALVEVNSVGKEVSRSIPGVDSSTLLAVKWNPFFAFNAAGVEATAATIEQAATGLLFNVNAAIDVNINSYTGSSGASNEIVYADATVLSVKAVIDIINGVAAGMPLPGTADYVLRWIAGLGDFRPGYTIGATTGVAVAAAEAMLGRSDPGMSVLADASGDVFSLALGSGHTKEGGGQRIPDHQQSEYVTNSAGSKVPVRSPARRHEEQPGHARYAVHLTKIVANCAYATTKVASVYDINDNLLAQYSMAAAAGSTVAEITEDTPLVGPPGSPLFVEITGTGLLTDGSVTIAGQERIA